MLHIGASSRLVCLLLWAVQIFLLKSVVCCWKSQQGQVQQHCCKYTKVKLISVRKQNDNLKDTESAIDLLLLINAAFRIPCEKMFTPWSMDGT